LHLGLQFSFMGCAGHYEISIALRGGIAPRQRAKAKNIHAIRMALDPQLRALWQFPPLSISAPKLLQFKVENDPASIGLAETRGNLAFIPIVSKKIDLQCALDITFLRRQAPGQLIGDGGDIDNRLKTLLDALSVPPLSQQDCFREEVPEPGQAILCLLQDDSLVTRLTVETDRLLRPTSSEYDLVALIHVSIKASQLTYANLGIAN
jgi:hypothetical protein